MLYVVLSIIVSGDDNNDAVQHGNLDRVGGCQSLS